MKPTSILICIALVVSFSTTVYSAEDKSRLIGRQLAAHEEAVTQLMYAAGSGDRTTLNESVVNIIRSEVFLSTAGFSAADPRLVGHLYDEQVRANGPNLFGFAFKVFHERLRRVTGYRSSLESSFNERSFANVIPNKDKETGR